MKEEDIIIENEDDGGNGDGKKKPEDLEVCAMCKHWNMVIQNPQLRIALGPCQNAEGADAGAPFGVVLAGFASCELWEKKEERNIITIPKKIANRMKGGPQGRLIL